MDTGATAITVNCTREEVVPPPHRIPPEFIVKIICEIFSAKINYPPRIEERISALLAVTRICRYWRYAALDDALLWSVVPVYRKILGPLFLQRSRDAPLSIVF